MTTAHGADVCRVTVVGPSRRVDIALPGYVPFAHLFPAVARYAGLDGPDAVAETGGWVLQRLGEEPFPPATTPAEAGLRDGELIYLRPHRAQLPALAIDDAADAIATGVGERPGRWSPRDAGGLALGVAGAALLAGAAVIEQSGPPWTRPALAAGIAAVVLLAAAAVAARAAGDTRAGAVLGWAATGYAFGAALLNVARTEPHGQFTATGLLAGFSAAALTAIISAAVTGEIALFFAPAVTALLGVAGAGLDLGVSLGGFGFAAAAVCVITPVLALTPLIPAACFRLARMELPQVPRSVEDLRRDTLDVNGAELLRRTAAADRFVTGCAAVLGLAGGAAAVALALSGGWIDTLASAVLACVLLLRSRLFAGLAQRLWLLLPGYLGLIVLAYRAAPEGPQLKHLALALGSLLAGTALVISVGRWLPGHRPSPFWGRGADIADTLLIVALFPMALAAAGVFTYLHGLHL
jgi:type VII secretion integral membrane protein EccD